MAEGHVVHFYARAHTRDLAGGPVTASAPYGRFAAVAAAVDGRVLQSVEARGKHLLYDFGLLVHVHLGLGGSWVRPREGRRPSVRFQATGTPRTWDLRAPRRFEVFTRAQRDALLLHLGPDPLRADADPDVAFERLHRSRMPLGAALLDQRILAGVGNVIRNELLFEFKLDPDVPASAVDRPLFDLMWARLVEVMSVSATVGRIVFDGSPRGRRHVYKQVVCARCGSEIRRGTVGGRSAYVCPSCQSSR